MTRINRAAALSALALLGCGAADQAEFGSATETITIDPNAVYQIVGVQSGKCAEIAGGSTANSAAYQIATCNTDRRQQFRLESLGNGYHRIRNVNSGLCADVEGVSTADGARIIQYSCGSGLNQQWSITDVANGVQRLTARHSGKSIDVYGASTADGARLVQWPSHGGTNQQFRLQVVNGNGGSGGGGGSGGSPSCPLPSSFQWTSTGPLAQPHSPAGANWASLKDFTITRHNNQYVVYATVHNSVPEGQPNRGWQGVHFNFTDFSQMNSATQTFIPGLVAPTLFYFSPKNIWVLAYQWGFQYRTSTNPSDPRSWSAPRSLLSGNPTAGHPAGTGPIDQTIICDNTNCYLFFAADNGYIYRSSMPIGSFPGTFSGAEVVLRDTPARLFEAVQVYSIKGSNQYLMIVEAYGPRYFRAFTATSLGGQWTPMPQASSQATPFAGANNVLFSGTRWTNDISHGDIVRDDPSEKQMIDPCNLRFLYQGADPRFQGGYGDVPYRPGLLTLVK